MIGSSAVAIGRGFTIKQMDEGGREAFVLPRLGVTGLKAVTQLIRPAKGAIGKRRNALEEALERTSCWA